MRLKMALQFGFDFKYFGHKLEDLLFDVIM